MNPLSPQTSGELIPSPVFLATCFLFIKIHSHLDLIIAKCIWICIYYLHPLLQIYDVLKLRSTRCSDIHIDYTRNRRQFAVHGSVAAWLNIVFNHCYILTEHQELLSSKHIYISRSGCRHIFKFKHISQINKKKGK